MKIAMAVSMVGLRTVISFNPLRSGALRRCKDKIKAGQL